MMQKIKTILIDDSEKALRLLYLMLQEFAPEIEILATAKNVEDGLKAIEKYQPDLLFLDIEMPQKSGLELAEELQKQKIACEIIFTTAYNQYAIKAFRLAAIDYLLKPIDENQLMQAVEKIKNKQQIKYDLLQLNALVQNLNSDSEKVLTFPVLNGFEHIPLKAVAYLEAAGSYTHIFLDNDKQKTASKNLKYFEKTLEGQPYFIRVHRSFIINIKHMHSFSRSGRGIIKMKNGKEIDLARDRRNAFFLYLEATNK